MGEPARALDEQHPTRARRRAAAAANGPSATGMAVVNGREAAGALLNPLRRQILQALAVPGSATTVATALESPRQLVNYHLRVLEKAGLVEEVGQRQRRGLTERVVRATAAHYLVAPDAIANLGATPGDVADRFSATYQVAVAARTIREVAALATLARQAGQRLTTLSIDTELTFASPATREAFANELLTAINELVAKYDQPAAANGRPYRLFAGSHPAYRAPEEAPKKSTKVPKRTHA